MADNRREGPREPLMVRKVTEVRLETPFSIKDLEQFLSAVGDEIGRSAEVISEVTWPENNYDRATVTLVATRLVEVEGYSPRPQAGEES